MPPSPARPGYINPSSPQSAGGLSLSFYAAAQSHPVSSPTVGVSNFDTNLHNIQREYTSAFEHGLTCPQNLTQLLVWLAKMLKSMYVECGLHIVERPCLNAYLRVFHLRVIVLIGHFNKKALVGEFSTYCEYQCRPMSVLETTTHCAVGSLVPVPEPLITADLSSWLQSPAQRPAGGGNQFDQSCTGCRLAG